MLSFLDEYACIEKILKEMKGVEVLKIIKIASHTSSFIYYILDNLVWASDIGILNKTIAAINIKWRRTKDMASLLRCILELFLSFVSVINLRKQI